MNEPKFQCIGRPLPRVDALDKVLGRAVYAGDISFPHMLYGKILRAGVPHAVIEEIDISAAEAMEGVACVLTARDIPGINRYGIAFPDQKVLAEDKVISIADPVAAVAAESPELARDAVKAIRVKYRALPVVTNPHEALAEGAPALHPEGNLFQYVKIRKGDVAEGFQQADIILEDTFQTQVQDHTYLETESGIARMDKQGNLILQTVSQGPFRDRAQVAAVCGLPQNRVRVIRATVGGAFGGKDDVSVQVHVALLAQATGRPVRLVFTREESLTTQTKRHAIEIWSRWGVTKDGKLCAMEGKVYGDTGAYAGLGPFVVKKCGIYLCGPYYIPAVKVDIYTTYTNNIIKSAYRGFGVLQASVVHEAMMDELALKCGIHPLKFRIMNALDVGLDTGTGQVMKEDCGIKATLKKMREVVMNDPTLKTHCEGLR